MMVTAVASGAHMAMGPGARQGGGVFERSGLEGMHKDHPAQQQECLPPGHVAQSPIQADPECFHGWGTPSSCGSTVGSLARSWGAVGSRHSAPLAKTKGRLCPDPPGCRSPSPCPACGAAEEPKVVGRAPCPAAAGAQENCSREWGIETAAASMAQGQGSPPATPRLSPHLPWLPLCLRGTAGRAEPRRAGVPRAGPVA